MAMAARLVELGGAEYDVAGVPEPVFTIAMDVPRFQWIHTPSEVPVVQPKLIQLAQKQRAASQGECWNAR